ncbi:hypothetical protein ABMA28_011909 [Loxostege sticticalis]|uniref:FP protein C-terminal domain-containing protein n=1 Tax=Loxostege sticticalis TaxID=481309 RepID=A0ABD0TL82_LOXSC
MFTCPLCNDNFSDGVKCFKCTVIYCFSCANITEVNYRKLGPARQAAVQCTSCKANQSQVEAVSSPGPQSSSSGATLDQVLQELRSGIDGINARLEQLPFIKNDIKNVKENLHNLETSIAGIKTVVEENTVKLADFEERIYTLENKPQPNSEYPQLQDEITKLTNELTAKDQMLRLNNIEIKGIPVKKNENLYEVVCKIGDLLGQHIDKTDINFVTRARSTTQASKPIIVGFLVRYKKQDFVASARLRKPGLTAQDLGFTGDMNKIYINDHLTKHNKQLLSKAKTLAREHNFNYVWVQNSRILTRKSETSPIIPINSESDLQKIK